MLYKPVESFVVELSSILSEKFGKTLYTIAPTDKLRLMKLKLWSERYQVPVEYILRRLLPFQARRTEYFSRKPRGNSARGLGTSIALLCGPASERKLQEFIAFDFASDQHKADWQSSKQQEILDVLQDVQGQPKKLLQYESVTAYVASYERHINVLSKEEKRLANKIAKQPFRGNPFR